MFFPLELGFGIEGNVDESEMELCKLLEKLLEIAKRNLNIKLVDQDGVTIETTLAQTENWNSDEKVRFSFSTDKDFKDLIQNDDKDSYQIIRKLGIFYPLHN